MSSLFFWKEWSRPYRFAYLISLSAVFVALILFIVAWGRGLGNVVRWDVLSELNELPVTFRTFTDGLLDYAVNGKAYAVSEQFVASPMQVNPHIATALLAGICIAFTLLLSAITRFDRVRYLVGMGALILGLAFFRFEMLEVPGLGGSRLFLILTVLFGSVSYFFHTFRSDQPILVRLGVFASLIGMTVATLGALSPVEQPVLTIVSYSMPVMLAFSIAFIFFIAAEILAGLVWVTTAGGSGKVLGLSNFLFISGLYLVNLVLIWLKNTRMIDWELLSISPFVLYLISVTLGIWGFRRLMEQQQLVSFRDGGAFLYAGLALLTTLTMGYAFATANDPLIEVFEDVIVYTHLAMGLAFIVYVLINFLPIFQQGRAVYRILYLPKRLELSLFRLVAVFLVLTLVASGNTITLKQAMAGYYNNLGDLYTATGELASAQAFYEQALEQEFQNHKSNYALASLATAQNDQTAAAFYFQKATLKQPQPHDYAALSQTFLQTDLFFEAVKTLQQGLRQFPGSGELQNNLGYLYARTSVADSAYYYLQAATGNTSRSDVPAANLLGFYARNPQVLSADSSLARNTNEFEYESYQANALALRLVASTGPAAQPVQPAWLTTDQVGEGLSVGRFASVYNYALASQQPDSTLARTLQRQADAPANQDFTDDLLLARAVAEYTAHNHPTAFGLLSQLAEGDPKQGDSYRSITGLLLMEQGLYRKAADQFADNSDTTSIYHRAVALTKAGDPALAQSLWETAARGDSNVSALKQVLYEERSPQTDLEKAFYVSYRLDNPNRGRYWETIRNPTLKTVAGVALANDYLDAVQWRNTQLMLSGLPADTTISDYAVSLRNLAALRLSAFRRSIGSAETMARQPILPQHQAERAYWLAQAYERSRQPAKAGVAYREALQLAPLNAQIVTAAAQFERQQNRIRPAYELVLKALLFNEDNAELLKTYVTLCLDQSLFDYASDGLARLRAAAPATDYQAFTATYQEKLASIEKSREKFGQ